MRTLIKPIEYRSRSDVFRIPVLPDVHMGNAAGDEDALVRFVKEVKSDPFSRWIGVGDTCEFINRRDKRFDEESLPLWLRPKADLVKAQRDRFIEEIRPIGPQCLGLAEGNHERTMKVRSERDVYGPICEALGATADNPLALDMCGFIRILFRRIKPRTLPEVWTLDLYVTHGWWDGQLMGNGCLNLERVFGWAAADVVIAGHDHKKKAFPLLRVKPNESGRVDETTGWCVGAGTLLGSPRYMEQARPLARGWVTLVIEPDKRSVRVLQ